MMGTHQKDMSPLEKVPIGLIWDNLSVTINDSKELQL